jgi:hypothetical protein
MYIYDRYVVGACSIYRAAKTAAPIKVVTEEEMLLAAVCAEQGADEVSRPQQN